MQPRSQPESLHGGLACGAGSPQPTPMINDGEQPTTNLGASRSWDFGFFFWASGDRGRQFLHPIGLYAKCSDLNG